MPDIGNYSDEIQQMMGRIPGWIIRWGLWIIGAIFIGVVIGCYLLKYPQIVTGTIELTASNPPAELLAIRSGRIAQLFVTDGDFVDCNSTVAVLENTANFQDVIRIDSLLKLNTSWPERVFDEAFYCDYRLGDIQSYFLQFQKECAAFREYLRLPLNANKERLLKLQIGKQEELLNYQYKQLSINEKDFELAQNEFYRDSILFTVDGVARADYEKSRQVILQKETVLIGWRSTVVNTEASLLSLRGNLIENQTQIELQVRTYSIEIDRLYRQLTTQIELWKRDNLLVAPVSGRLFLSNIWSANQNVVATERVATVVPQDSTVVMGRMTVPFSGYSKINAGQTVNIRLDNYPYMEYGMIRGQIYSVSPIPEKEGYIVEITFPKGFVTSYGIPIAYVYRMTGSADIVTKDMRLIEQFIQPLKAVLDRL